VVVVVLIERDPPLPHVVLTVNAMRGLTDHLDGGQEQRDQDGDDGNHHQ
jgi:hypothetical protein